jgi:hypothetical protein
VISYINTHRRKKHTKPKHRRIFRMLNKVRLNVRISEAKRKKLKIFTMINDTTISEVVRKLVDEYIQENEDR